MTAADDAGALAACLTGELTLESFDQTVREKTARWFEAAIPLELLRELYDLSRLEALLAHDAVPLSYVDVYSDGHLVRLPDMQRKSGKSGLDVVTDSFRRGSTIRVRDVARFDARLDQFQREVQRRFAADADVNLYLTPPSQAGFPAHFDITDVFVIQCRGRKRWRLYGEYAHQKALPLPATSWDPAHFTPVVASARTVTLAPGDVLYLPRGIMHDAACLDEESMHLTVGIVPLTFAELLGKVLKEAVESDLALRERIPWTSDDASLAALVRERLRRLDGVDVAALLASERSRLSTPAPVLDSPLQTAIAALLGRAAG